MIRMLKTKTIGGQIYPAGSVLILSPPIESQLIASADADLGLLPTLVAQSYAGWTRSSANAATDTVYQTIASVTMPGGTMGLNSKLVVIIDWDFPSSASTKTLAVDFGGSNISGIALTTGPIMGKIMLEIQNLNSLSLQKTMASSSYGVSANARIPSSIDTSQDVAVAFKVKWGGATTSEILTLLGYSLWHYPGS